MRRFILQAALLTATACSSDNNAKSESDPEAPLPTDDTGTAPDGDDTGVAPDPITPVDISAASGPCGEANWGLITAPETTIHIAGDDAAHQLDDSLVADGTMTHPFRSLADFEAHLATSPTISQTAVAFWPGVHTLQSESGQALAQLELPVQGCGPETSQFVPAADGSTGPTIRLTDGASLTLEGLFITAPFDHPAVLVEASANLTLSNSTVKGHSSAAAILGRTGAALALSGIEVDGGATGVWTNGSATSLTMNASTISNAGMAGVWTNGSATSLTDVVVKDTVGLPGMSGSRGGWGVVLNDSPIMLTDVVIQDVTAAGLVLNNTAGTVDDIRVERVALNAEGEFGRGIHAAGSLDSETGLTLMNVEVSEVHDAGIYARNTHPLKLENITIRNVDAATYSIAEEPPDTEGLDSTTPPTPGLLETGDGLVVVQRGWVGTANPYVNCVELIGSNRFTGISRAGIIADASFLTLEMPEELDAVATYRDTAISVFPQHSGIVDWGDDAPSEWVDSAEGDGYPGAVPFGFNDDDVADDDAMGGGSGPAGESGE